MNFTMIFNELCLDDQGRTFYNKGDQSHANFAERRTITICGSLIRKENCIQMSLQLLSSTADCSSVLQLDPAASELFHRRGHLDSAVSCISASHKFRHSAQNRGSTNPFRSSP